MAEFNIKTILTGALVGLVYSLFVIGSSIIGGFFGTQFIVAIFGMTVLGGLIGFLIGLVEFQEIAQYGVVGILTPVTNNILVILIGQPVPPLVFVENIVLGGLLGVGIGAVISSRLK